MRFGRLREAISTKYGTLQKFADASGIKYCSLVRKLSNKTEFTRVEMAKCCELLDIHLERIHEYFFYT